MGFLKRRPLFLVIMLMMLGVIAVVAALPLWFPWVLRPVSNRLGATYAHYERIGYQQFQLTGLAFTNRAGRFEAKRVEAFLPTVWLWRCFAGPKAAPFLRVDSWAWKVNPVGLRKRGQASSPYRILRNTVSKISTFKTWLPRAELTRGTFHLKGATVQIQHVLWADGKLSAQLGSPRFNKTFQFLLAIKSLTPPGLKLKLDAAALQFNSRFTITGVEHRLNLQGTAFWLGNRSELKALFPEHGFLPATASLRTKSFSFPARLLRLKHYQNLTGSLNAIWRTNRFKLELTARAFPRSANWPPVHIETRASGNTHSARIDAARISLPWVDAKFSRQTQILFKPPYLAQPATLEVVAHLAKQPWFMAKGELAGVADLQPGSARFPKIQFAVNGADVSISNLAARALQLKGDINWPFTNSATLQVEGLKFPHSRPLHLEASWQGRGLNLRQLQLGLNAGNSSLRLRGSVQLDGIEKKLDVTTLELSRSNRTELHLQQPFEATFQRNPPAASNSWSLTLQRVRLAGRESGLKLAAALSWPRTGTFQLSAHHLNTGLIRDFLEGAAPEAGLKRLNFTAGWTNSPVVFHLDSLADWKAKNEPVFGADAQVNASTNGISIQRLALSSGTQTVCHAEGILPITLEPGGTNKFVQINLHGPLRLRASTQTNSVLWQEIARASGLLLVGPQLKASVDGTWAAPRGQITLRAQRIEFPQVKRPLPTLEKLALSAEVNPGEVRLSRFHFLFQGQPVQFTAQMPFQKSFWSTLWSQRRLPVWRKATAHLKIANAELAAFAKLMPGVLSPQGALRADVTLHPGGVLTGELAVTNAATLPLAALGAVQDIQFAVDFAGEAAELTNFSASIGGQTVTADGRMPLNLQTWQGRGLPPFVIRLRGTNVPLVRKPSLLLRANFALALTNTASRLGVVAGDVTLRDSLFLANLQSLIPKNAVASAHHPPYFSVAAHPWSGWHLDVKVNGSQFMRVQTPVFHGKVSATMKLQGTLGNPLALGEVKIASGTVTFPFGSLDVNQGFISLTSDHPYHPRLFITAQTQQFGYNITLEVTGTADNPIVQFSSTPPLSSQEIVMMLATGQLPAGTGVSTSTQQRAQGLALFFGRNLLSEFGLGFGENRLTIHSGQQISEEGRPTYEADYKISKRWSLVGQYDRFDQYDLNLKWNVFSR